MTPPPLIVTPPPPYALTTHTITLTLLSDTPLGLVCGRHSHVQCIMPLLSGGAHIDFRGKDGLTPLHRAAIGGNAQAVKVQCPYSQGTPPPLLKIYECGETSIIRACLPNLISCKAIESHYSYMYLNFTHRNNDIHRSHAAPSDIEYMV